MRQHGQTRVTGSLRLTGARLTWTDSSGKFWMFGGNGVDGSGVSGQLNDLWMYDPTIQQWTWESGTQAANVAPSYGTQGVPASGNQPGGRHGSMVWHIWDASAEHSRGSLTTAHRWDFTALPCRALITFKRPLW